jgi:hypothetical protein
MMPKLVGQRLPRLRSPVEVFPRPRQGLEGAMVEHHPALYARRTGLGLGRQGDALTHGVDLAARRMRERLRGYLDGLYSLEEFVGHFARQPADQDLEISVANDSPPPHRRVLGTRHSARGTRYSVLGTFAPSMAPPYTFCNACPTSATMSS